MSYPERGAVYKNRPAWLDRAVDGEKRAQGGSASEPKPPLTPDSNQFNPDSPTGRFTDRSPRRADGGRMEPLIDEKGNPNPDNYWDHLVEPSSPHAAQDAREAAAATTRRAATSPRTPGPITKSLVAAGAAPLVLGRLTADTVKGVADRINSPDNREQVAEGMGRMGRRRGGRT